MSTIVHRYGLNTIVALLVVHPSLAFANTDIHLETVSDYTFVSGGSTVNNTDANTEGSGFWNPMAASGTWTPGVFYQDNNVFDTDLYDPDVTGNSVDDDTNNFDTSSTALSFFIGHGSCNDTTFSSCTSDSDCSPLWGNNAYCPSFPLPAGQTAACIKQSPRVMLTSSTASSHNNTISYGNGIYNMAFGESSNSGGWDGAGTNGGSNVVMIVNSCGFRSHLLGDEQAVMYGGVHMLMVTMPVGNAVTGNGTGVVSDTAQWSSRGSTLANDILANVNAPANSAWLDPQFVDNSYNGFGANVVGAFDTTGAGASDRVNNETWQQSTDDSRDPTGTGVGVWLEECNFSNCGNYTL